MRITYEQAKEYDDYSTMYRGKTYHSESRENIARDRADFFDKSAREPPVSVVKEHISFVPFDDNSPATVVETKKTIEIINCTNQNRGNGLRKTKKLPGGMYLNTETGEIFSAKKKTARTDNSTNLNKSIKELWRLIEENFEDTEGFFITLAYFGVMTDYRKASKDFEKFKDKLMYHYRMEFIKVVEPKSNGSWHFHILAKPKEGHTLEIEEEKIQKLWTHGSVCVEPITSIKGLQMYLAASGTKRTRTVDDESGIFMLLDCEISGKKIREKQKRRAFYKSGMRLYSCSRGIKKPVRYKTSNGMAKKLVAGYTKTSAESVAIKTKNGQTLNLVSYETYSK